MPSGRTIVVTGATGHIGTNLVRQLIANGERPRVLVRNPTTRFDDADVVQVPGDILDAASLRAAFTGASWVFHLAAAISIDARDDATVLDTNTRGPANVVDACLSCAVTRLVHFSSVHAFAPQPHGAPLDETRGPTPDRSPFAYDRSKAAGERIVREAIARGLDAVIVNPTGVLGPYDHRPSPMGEALSRAFRGKLPVLVSGGFDWVDVRDVALGALAAAECGRRGERYILGGHWASVKELFGTAARIANVRAPMIVVPARAALLFAPVAEHWAALTGRRALYTHASIETLQRHRDVRHSKAERELGYRPRPLVETLQDTHRWFLEAARR